MSTSVPTFSIDSFKEVVLGNYGRFPLTLTHGKGSRVWDDQGHEYLDFGTGIAVNALGHAHPDLSKALADQAQTLMHVSNLYYVPEQEQLARALNHRLGKGSSFFCNSGAEANECLYKLARKHGNPHGRYEIITSEQSFHGRTLAGIAATGQAKVKTGFDPAVPGFIHVPFHDLDAVKKATTPQTAAVLIEAVLGESGIHPVSAEYLRGLRSWCDQQSILLMIDAIQCGMYRTGCFHSYQRILETSPEQPVDFLPDAVSMAKGLGGGIPIGATWIAHPYRNVLGPGSHGTTYGGNPLACRAALTVFEVIERDHLDQNARTRGEEIKKALIQLKSPLISGVRGLGLMIAFDLQQDIPTLKVEGRSPSLVLVDRLHSKGLLTVPSGTHSIRILPPLNTTSSEVSEAIDKLDSVLKELA